MSTANTDTYNLKSVEYGGIIHEDVMSKLWLVDPVDLAYQDMAGVGEAATNMYKSWVEEGLAAPDLTNARVDGADAGAAGTFTEARVGNQIQLSDAVVRVSTGARLVDTIGYGDRLVHELMIRQKELKRTMEAILVSNQASVAMTDAAAGKLAGCGAMFKTNIINGTTAGFANGIYPAPTPGTARALTENDIRNGAENAYNEGGNPRVLMTTPKMIRGISEYLFTATARVATLMTDATPAQARQDGKYGKKGVTAVGAINSFVSDFDVFEFTPNRLQQAYDVGGTSCVNVYLFDPEYWDVSFLQNIRTEELGKTGTADNRQMTVYYTNLSLAEKASAVIMGINPAIPMTAS